MLRRKQRYLNRQRQYQQQQQQQLISDQKWRSKMYGEDAHVHQKHIASTLPIGAPNYKLPPPSSSQFGMPMPPSSSQFGAANYNTQPSQFGMPSSSQFGTPSSSQFGTPMTPSSSQQYGAPPPPQDDIRNIRQDLHDFGNNHHDPYDIVRNYPRYGSQREFNNANFESHRYGNHTAGNRKSGYTRTFVDDAEGGDYDAGSWTSHLPQSEDTFSSRYSQRSWPTPPPPRPPPPAQIVPVMNPLDQRLQNDFRYCLARTREQFNSCQANAPSFYYRYGYLYPVPACVNQFYNQTRQCGIEYNVFK